jgi:hypothetical protein
MGQLCTHTRRGVGTVTTPTLQGLCSTEWRLQTAPGLKDNGTPHSNSQDITPPEKVMWQQSQHTRSASKLASLYTLHLTFPYLIVPGPQY